MKTQLTSTVLASLTVMTAFTVAIQRMNSPVFAGDDDNNNDRQKLYSYKEYSQHYKSSDGK
jgi:hypothetical protein